jgi:hypothetical protein
LTDPSTVAKDRAVSRRYLPGHQSEPGGEVAPLGEHLAAADRGQHGARDDRSDARHRHQTLARRVLLHQFCDVARQAFDALVKPPPVAGQILDDAHHARRQHVSTLGKDDRQFGAKEALFLAYRNPALQQERTRRPSDLRRRL